MTRRIVLLALALNLAITAIAAWAQQTSKVPVLGVLFFAAGSDDPVVEDLRQGLRALGYVEGRNIRIDFRTAQDHPDRLPGLAEELVQLKVDVILVNVTVAAQAAKRATSSIPIVMATVADPVGSGLVASLAHPGGNLTGNSLMLTELGPTRLQLLKETIPRLASVAVLWNPVTPIHHEMVEKLKAVAPSLSLKLSFMSARSPEQFDSAFSAVSRAHAGALYVLDDPVFYVHRTTLAKLASNARLPTIYGARDYAEAGGLMSYGADYAHLFRRSAGYVDKILKGAKPAEIPVEQPTKFDFVVNLKTAKALGITMPQSILLRADEVIR
ncbi:MAG: ABC transporter substrate-binding protein [bacterium]